MDECAFCEIVAGAAASRVFEDERAVAFLDLFPVHPGHVLLVPRQHVRDLATCPAELAGYLFALAGRVGPGAVRAVAGDGFNVWTASGAAAGQEVFHLHLHVLPRFAGDAFGLRFPKSYPRKASRTELDEMAARIRREL
ncbi:MAG TPA: HIT family protein [Gemmatimonadales bacterium]